jgi:hypothetical protein
MELSGQLHAPAAIHPGKYPMVLNGWEAVWAPETVWTLWKREKCLTPDRNRPPAVSRRYIGSSINILIFMFNRLKYELILNNRNSVPTSRETFAVSIAESSRLMLLRKDRLCGLVVRIPGYRSRDPGFDSRRYQIFAEVVGLGRGPLSLMRITEELSEWKSSGSGSRKSRITAVGIRCADLYPQKLALTPSTSGGRSVGIVRLRTKGTELSLVLGKQSLFTLRIIQNTRVISVGKR